MEEREVRKERKRWFLKLPKILYPNWASLGHKISIFLSYFPSFEKRLVHSCFINSFQPSFKLCFKSYFIIVGKKTTTSWATFCDKFKKIIALLKVHWAHQLLWSIRSDQTKLPPQMQSMKVFVFKCILRASLRGKEEKSIIIRYHRLLLKPSGHFYLSHNSSSTCLKSKHYMSPTNPVVQ